MGSVALAVIRMRSATKRAPTWASVGAGTACTDISGAGAPGGESANYDFATQLCSANTHCVGFQMAAVWNNYRPQMLCTVSFALSDCQDNSQWTAYIKD